MPATAMRSDGALIAQPLMRNVLADLALESDAATMLMMRLARAFDEGDRTFAQPGGGRGQVLGVEARARSWPKRWNAWAAMASSKSRMMPRLYREAPLNSIWEGSGNVIALDVLRAIVKEPETLERVAGRDSAGRRPAPGEIRGGYPAGCFRAGRRTPRGGAAGAGAAGIAAHPFQPARLAGRLLRVAPGGRLGTRFRHAAARPRSRLDPLLDTLETLGTLSLSF